MVNTVDPVAGSYFIEQETNRIEDAAVALLSRIDAAGGTLAAIEQGLIQREIQESAYRAQQAIDTRASIVVGVNQFATSEPHSSSCCASIRRSNAARSSGCAQVRASRDSSAWRDALDAVRAAARGSDNLVPFIIDAVEARATVGEISDAMRTVFGEHIEIDV